MIAALVRKYRSAAQCAAALGISRQAFRAAMQRGKLSNAVALRAAALLSNHPAAPIDDAAANLPAKLHITTYHPTNYARCKPEKNTAIAVSIHPHVHVITSAIQQEAIDLIRWVLAVAKLPADSPRFNWYVSRWAVPEKIARAKQDGTFPALVANCPPIDPSWIRFVPAALAACDAFKATTNRPTKPARASSVTHGKSGKPYKLAA